MYTKIITNEIEILKKIIRNWTDCLNYIVCRCIPPIDGGIGFFLNQDTIYSAYSVDIGKKETSCSK